MTISRKAAAAALVLVLGALAAGGGAVLAAPTADPFANEPPAPAGGIAISRPSEPRKAAAPPAPPQIGNPLWAIPLSELTVTQDRPMFAPSRRPPPRAVAVAPVVAPPPMAPVALPPEPLQLSLIGAVVGDGDAIAVFVDKTTQGIVRLRAGQVHAGWSLSSISPREATLKRGNQTEALTIQRAEAGGQMPLPIPSFTGAIPQPPRSGGGAVPSQPQRRFLPPDNL